MFFYESKAYEPVEIDWEKMRKIRRGFWKRNLSLSIGKVPRLNGLNVAF